MKKYTRLQIEKAIDYWTRQLGVLSESKSKVINSLILEFGEDVVCSKEQTYQLNDEDLKKIFNILNFHFFDSALKDIPIVYWPENKVVNLLNYLSALGEYYEKKYVKAPCYGVHGAACKEIKDDANLIIDINLSNDIIMMNSSYLKKCVFIFGIACILHEMIHYCDRFSYEFKLHSIKHALDEKYNWDPHLDKIFILKKKLAIENGINVVNKFENNETYDSANLKARIVLQNVLDDNETKSENSITHISNNVVTLKTKGSDKFAIFNFD